MKYAQIDWDFNIIDMMSAKDAAEFKKLDTKERFMVKLMAHGWKRGDKLPGWHCVDHGWFAR